MDKNSPQNNPQQANFNEKTFVNFDAYTSTTPLKQALDSFINSVDPSGDKTHIQSKLTRAWEEITGPSTIAHTLSIFRRGNMVVVWVDDPVWASNIRMLESMYVEKLREALNDQTLERVRIEVHRQGNSFRRSNGK